MRPFIQPFLTSLFRPLAAGLIALAASTAPALAGKDLDAIRARGSLVCGVAANGLAGFMVVDSQGKWTGIDVDVCRAVAAALFGDAEKVKYVPVTGDRKSTRLNSGHIPLSRMPSSA